MSCSHNAAVSGCTSLPSLQQFAKLPWQLWQRVLAKFPGTALYIYDLIAQCKLYSSHSLGMMLGYTANEIKAMAAEELAQLIHPDDLELVSDHFQRFSILQAGEVIEIEYRMKRADGQWCWLQARETPYKQASGASPLQLIGMMRDITEQKDLERLLGSFSLAIEYLSEIVMITNRVGAIVYVNVAWEQMTGYSRAAAIGKTPAIVKSGQHNIAFYRQLWNTLQSNRIFQAKFLNRKKNGDLFYEEKTITPIKNDLGQTIHFLSMGREVTDY